MSFTLPFEYVGLSTRTYDQRAVSLRQRCSAVLPLSFLEPSSLFLESIPVC
jgi:hypothetical protein